MPVYRLPEQHAFPHPNEAEENGLLAIGGDLDPARVLLAYYYGIFPWYSEGEPILWWSPNPRMVLYPNALKISRSLRKRIRRGDYEITMNQAFRDVITQCRQTPRPGQNGTWITSEMIECYAQLHKMGFAHSVEAWQNGALVGGLYGISIGAFFAGESMFALAPDASKCAFVHLVRQTHEWGFQFIDCQMHTPHLERFGAQLIPRSVFLTELDEAVQNRHEPRQWAFNSDLQVLP